MGMLALSRKVGESVTIGKAVVVTIVRINGNRVTLSVQAPEEVSIVRTEIASQPPKPHHRQRNEKLGGQP